MAKGAKKQLQAQAQAGAGKGKHPTGPPQSLHKDLYHRYNFTFQASAFLHHLDEASSSSSAIASKEASSSSRALPTVGIRLDRKGKKRSIEYPDDGEHGIPGKFALLARCGMSSAGKMVEHNQMKLDPSIKRNTCRVCSTVLIPGLTARIRNRPNRTHFNVTHTTCLVCYTARTIPSPPTAPTSPTILDGPVRARRRAQAKSRSKVTFHEREAVPGQRSQASGKGDSGHTLWRDGEMVQGWGERPDHDPEER